jgi:hypothetical protein
MYDRGTYNGKFRTFDVEETDDQPFAFKVSFSFKVEEELMKIPNLGSNANQRGILSPAFQSRNTVTSQNYNNPGTQATSPTSIATTFQNAALNQQISSVQASQGVAYATSAQQASITALLNKAQVAAQTGDYNTAFQSTSAAQTAVAALPQNLTPTEISLLNTLKK